MLGRLYCLNLKIFSYCMSSFNIGPTAKTTISVFFTPLCYSIRHNMLYNSVAVPLSLLLLQQPHRGITQNYKQAGFAPNPTKHLYIHSRLYVCISCIPLFKSRNSINFLEDIECDPHFDSTLTKFKLNINDMVIFHSCMFTFIKNSRFLFNI